WSATRAARLAEPADVSVASDSSSRRVVNCIGASEVCRRSAPATSVLGPDLDTRRGRLERRGTVTAPAQTSVRMTQQGAVSVVQIAEHVTAPVGREVEDAVGFVVAHDPLRWVLRISGAEPLDP